MPRGSITRRRLLGSACLACLIAGCGGEVGGETPDRDAGARHWRPSCRAAAPGADGACGADGDVDCCGVGVVPAQQFLRRNLDQWPATVSDFRLDTLEVTVGRFRRYLSTRGDWLPPEGAGAHPLHPDTGWHSAWNAELALTAQDVATLAAIAGHADCPWTEAPGPHERHAMACVTWWDALAFCVWDGGRLPTALERSCAYVGGDEQRRYPWGNADCDPEHSTAAAHGDGLTFAVGAAPKGAARWGHLDLDGGQTESALDFAGAVAPPTCDDCLQNEATGGPGECGTNIGIDCSSGREDHCWEVGLGTLGTRSGFRCIYDGPLPGDADAGAAP